MPTFRKPKIGLLGLMTDGYEPNFPGITARQEKFANDLTQLFADKMELIFTKAAGNRAEIEQTMENFNAQKLDGVLIICLTYSQGAWITRALQNNNLPIALAVVQPDSIIDQSFGELELTVNQGIHGAQDNANAIGRGGFKCEFFAGDRHSERFKTFVYDFAKAAQTYCYLRNLKVSVIGKLGGMGDVVTDESAFFRKIGPECYNDCIGVVANLMNEVSQKEIDDEIKRDRETFEIDPKLTYESHAEANKMYIALKRFLNYGGYHAFTAHFEVFGQDGRFKQLPFLAASKLMADGYGYAAEGDSLCAAMVSAAHCLDRGNANFTEMYSMDFKERAIILCHAGEANHATCRSDKKPRLIDKVFLEGGLGNPPTPMFTPQFGRATLTSFVGLCGDKFRLVVSKGEILPKDDMKNCEMPYIWYRPDNEMETMVENWLKNCGTHHEVINLGDCSERWRMLCNMLDVEYVEV